MARRSVLFTPGNRPEMLRKAPQAGADVLVFDLEDAVGPDEKDAARQAVNDVLADPSFDPDAEVCVRVNGVGEAGEDIEAALAGLPSGAVDAVMLPKVAGAEDVETLARLLREHDHDLPVLALVETAAGVLAAEEIAAARPTDALVFGAEDLAADLGATRTEEGSEVLYAREHVVLAASAAGVDAIDTVYTDFEDETGLREATAFAVELGFGGKLAIHPSQVAPINEAFTPTAEQREWAARVLDAREAADGGVFEVDGEMIDAPLVAQAERVAERAAAAGVWDGPSWEA